MTRDDWSRLSQCVLPLLLVAQWLPQALGPRAGMHPAGLGSFTTGLTLFTCLLLAWAVLMVIIRWGKPDKIYGARSARVLEVVWLLAGAAMVALAVIDLEAGPLAMALRIFCFAFIAVVVVGRHTCKRTAEALPQARGEQTKAEDPRSGR